MKVFEDYQDTVRKTLEQVTRENMLLFRWFTAVSRLIIAFLAVIIVYRLARSLFSGKKQPETWGYLNLQNGSHIPVNHWENLIGRAKSCDIILNFPTVSRNHAILMRREDTSWRLIDINSKTGIKVKDERVEKEAIVGYGDVIDIGGVTAQFVPLSKFEQMREEMREIPGREIKPALTMYLLTVFDIILSIQLCFSNPGGFIFAVPVCFCLLIAVIWGYFFFVRMMRRRGFEVEQVAFFMSSVGLSVTASSSPQAMYKQFVSIVLGLIIFLVLGWFLRDLKRADLMRWPMAAAAIALLLFTIVAGSVVGGAKNWVFIGNLSIQPSELAKLCFIYAGTATLDRLFAKRNLVLYMTLTVCIAGALAYMSDFGAAIIFFIAFLVVAFMRSGDVATLSLICLAAFLGVMLLLRFKPYIAYRFAGWRHAWDSPHDIGFQQTRTMTAIASGGFFGVGAGNGWLKNIAAADTDLVYGVVVEELGLFVGAGCIACVVILALFSFISASQGRSTFYTIAACAAVSMLLFQMMLNVLGSLDILPLTGVTFPFVSKGGSSMLSCFGLLAFVKAADIRRLASFAASRYKHSVHRGNIT